MHSVQCKEGSFPPSDITRCDCMLTFNSVSLLWNACFRLNKHNRVNISVIVGITKIATQSHLWTAFIIYLVFLNKKEEKCPINKLIFSNCEYCKSLRKWVRIPIFKLYWLKFFQIHQSALQFSASGLLKITLSAVSASNSCHCCLQIAILTNASTVISC